MNIFNEFCKLIGYTVINGAISFFNLKISVMIFDRFISSCTAIVGLVSGFLAIILITLQIIKICTYLKDRNEEKRKNSKNK